MKSEASRETEVHFTAIGMPWEHNSNMCRFRRAAFYHAARQSVKSKVGPAAAKAVLLRINLNVDGTIIKEIRWMRCFEVWANSKSANKIAFEAKEEARSSSVCGNVVCVCVRQ